MKCPQLDDLASQRISDETLGIANLKDENEVLDCVGEDAKLLIHTNLSDDSKMELGLEDFLQRKVAKENIRILLQVWWLRVLRSSINWYFRCKSNQGLLNCIDDQEIEEYPFRPSKDDWICFKTNMSTSWCKKSKHCSSILTGKIV